MRFTTLFAAFAVTGAMAATPAFAEMGACKGAWHQDDPVHQIRLYTICLDGLWDSARAGAHHNRGVAYLMTEEYGKAENDFGASIFYDDDYGLAYVNRAIAMARQGARTSAIADLTEALDRLPSRVHTDAHLQRGVLLEARGDYDGALADFDAVIDRQMPASFLAFMDHELERKRQQITQGMMAKSLLLSTAEDPAYRDGAQAVALAEAAMERAYGADRAPARAVMAAALAESGRFEEAATYQAEALALAERAQSPRLELLTDILESYRAGEPYHAEGANCAMVVAGVDCRGGGWRMERMTLRSTNINVGGFGGPVGNAAAAPF